MNGLALIEAAQDLDATPRDREVRLLSAAAQTFGANRPVLAGPIPRGWDYSGFCVEEVARANCDVDIVQGCLEVSAVMRRAERLAVGFAPPACVLMAGLLHASDAVVVARQRGVGDMVALLGTDGHGEGYQVLTLAPGAERWSRRVYAYWSQIAQHLGAAWRLVNHGPGEVRATFSADGRVGDLAPEAVTAREALRDAVLRREAARSHRRSADPEALWPAMVEGRWTLVDAFTSAGHRYVVAYENPATTPQLRAVEPTARMVLELLLSGRSGKWIALELGISEAAVVRRARSALRTLGACDLASLAGVRSAMFEPIYPVGSGPTLALARLTPVVSTMVDLSSAEREVMASVVAGKRTAAIARERGTSERTVSNQIASIYRKTGVTSRRELIALFG
jgi:DNA-binding NarL/FixJ family response regulator